MSFRVEQQPPSISPAIINIIMCFTLRFLRFAPAQRRVTSFLIQSQHLVNNTRPHFRLRIGDSSSGNCIDDFAPSSKLDPVWNGGQGRKLSPGAFFSFSDVHCQGSTRRGQTKQATKNMKLPNLIHVLLGIFCIALLPKAQAVVPPPDGGYPNFTTAEGDHALQALTSGLGNTAIGTFSLFSVTTGSFNTAVGAGALDLNTADSNTATGTAALLFNTIGTENTANGTAALEFNQTGSNNTANGAFALFSNTIGSENTAIGVAALRDNTTGVDNTATGFQALMSNTGVENTANGSSALQSNTVGEANTAIGSQALSLNTQGSGNTATGGSALFSNSTGDFNTANGDEALFANTTGVQNTAAGSAALTSNTIGGGNTAYGFQALLNNTSGAANIAIGLQALSGNVNGNLNIAIGGTSLFTNIAGNDNIALGTSAGSNTTGSHNVDIANAGVAGESDTIRIGQSTHDRTFIAGIRGKTTGNANAIPVVIDSDGQLGTMSSSRRFKHEIKPMDSASQAILSLKPVTFNYKSDNTNTPQFGLIAEDVAAVNPDLVVRDDNSQIYTVRYDAVNAMLLNEFLKEHRKVEAQQKQIDALTTRLAQQAAQIQKVSALVETSKPAPQIVNNP